MALIPLAELQDFQLVDGNQDCRGWTVRDTAGRRVATVQEMLVDTERKCVAALVLDSGVQVPAEAVSFKDGVVHLHHAQSHERPDITHVTVPIVG